MIAYTGVDPGSKSTGVTTLVSTDSDPDELLLVEAEVIERKAEWSDWYYIRQVLMEVLHQQRVALGTVDGRARVGIEVVNPPHAWRNGQKVPINPGSLIGTAMIYGAVVAHYQAVPLKPLGFGSAPRKTYPGALWGPRESDAGTGKLRHARSAHDVALAMAGRWDAKAKGPRRSGAPPGK